MWKLIFAVAVPIWFFAGEGQDAPEPGAFVTLAGSGITSGAKDRWPYAQVEDGAGDVSGWTRVNVESASELSAASIGCSALAGDGSTDDAANLQCMLDDADSEGVCLEFTAGNTYQLESSYPSENAFYRPRSGINRRCLVSDTPGTRATLRVGGLECEDGDANGVCDSGTLAGEVAHGSLGLPMFEGDDPSYGSDLGWTDGGSRGDTDLTFTSVSGLADGDWLLLESTPTGQQPDGDVHYRAKVVGTPTTGANGVTIDRPLPDDFAGTLTAREVLNPPTGWHFEDLELTYEHLAHQNGNSIAFTSKGMYEWTLKNVKVRSYQRAVFPTLGARGRMERVDVDVEFDKPFNTAGIVIGPSSDITLIDSIVSSPESLGCAGNAQNIYIGFSYFPAPVVNASYDDSCSGDCDWTDIVAHDTAHGPVDSCTDTSPADGECDARTGETPAADGLYTHCSSGESDRLGASGTASCRGTRSDEANGSITLHNASCSNMLVERSHLETGIWTDFFEGPGRYNAVTTSLFNEAPIFGNARCGDLDSCADIGHKFGGAGDLRPDYAFDMMLIGNSVRYIGGGVMNVFDRMADDVHVEGNAIRVGCEMAADVTAITDDCGAAVAPGEDQGSHTGSSSTTTLTDATYIPDPSVVDLVGATLWNLSDGVSCTVGTHTSTTLVCDAPLPGSNTWDSGEGWALGGVNIEWSNNDVLASPTDTPTIPITLPSATGYDSAPSFGGTGTFPYVGADQGAVSAAGDPQNCLPAYERYHGSC